MSERSRYDELHDRFHDIRTTKKGTRYEILAAVVFAALERDAVVIHDVRLVGQDTGVKHQIDVHIERDGVERRILVECKDYDVRGADVGLGVVRDFWGVVDDVHPNEAWIITCNGFTRDAMKFAKGKGIKLATLRVFEDEDWVNRVHTFVVNVTYVTVDIGHPKVDINMSDEDGVRFGRDFAAYGPMEIDASPAVLYDGQTATRLGDILRSMERTDVTDNSTEVVVARMTPGGWVTADGHANYPMNGYRIAAAVIRHGQELRVSADRGAAQLLLSGGEGLDFVLWENALSGYVIEDDGTVVVADAAAQKRLEHWVSPLRKVLPDAT